MAATAYPPTNPASAPPAKLPKAGFFWALGIFLVTAIAGVALFALGISEIVDSVDGLDEIPVPGEAALELDTGDHWVFAVVPGSRELADQVDVTITDPNGATQTLTQETFPGSETSSDGEQFVPLGFFDADTAGTYRFETAGPPGTSVRVGTLSLGTILGFIFGGIGIGFVGFVIALIILIVTLVRRGGAKKRQRASAYAGYAAGAPSQQYPGQAAQYPGGPPQQPGAPPP